MQVVPPESRDVFHRQAEPQPCMLHPLSSSKGKEHLQVWLTTTLTCQFGIRDMGSKMQALLVMLAVAAVVIQAGEAGTPFFANFLASTDASHTRVLNGGDHVDLVLDRTSAAAFGSKSSFLFGSIGMGIKLPPGNSAGTVTAYYLSSQGAYHDEMDFEFLGNSSGQPYILQTNVFAKGQGNREQRMTLWFDPTADYHTYSLLWNKNMIVFYVDTTPVRVYRNHEYMGIPFPNSQGVGIYASLWDGSKWATQGGKVQLDWQAAPFVASFQGFGVDSCEVHGWDPNGVNACRYGPGKWWDGPTFQNLTWNQIGLLHDVRNKHIVYDYCTDYQRFPTPPAECAHNWYQY